MESDLNLEELTKALEDKSYKENDSLLHSNIEAFVRENEKKTKTNSAASTADKETPRSLEYYFTTYTPKILMTAHKMLFGQIIFYGFHLTDMRQSCS